MSGRIWFISAMAALIVIGTVGCSANSSGDEPVVPAAECMVGYVECDDTPTETLPPADVVEPDPGVAVPLALADSADAEGAGPVAIEGFFIDDGQEAHLCGALLESFPPQCGGPSLVIANPEQLIDVVLVEDGGTRWSETYITVVGEIVGGILTVAGAS